MIILFFLLWISSMIYTQETQNAKIQEYLGKALPQTIKVYKKT